MTEVEFFKRKNEIFGLEIVPEDQMFNIEDQDGMTPEMVESYRENILLDTYTDKNMCPYCRFYNIVNDGRCMEKTLTLECPMSASCNACWLEYGSYRQALRATKEDSLKDYARNNPDLTKNLEDLLDEYNESVGSVGIENKFIIEDWIGNVMFHGKKFNSLDDGWAYIYENIEDIDNAYDDVFVVPAKD